MANKLTKLSINRVDLVDRPSNPMARVALFKRDLSTKERNNLSDSAFAYIGPDGQRHLPIHDAAHVRNALARLNQTDISPAAKASAKRKIMAAAKKFGVKVTKGMMGPMTTEQVINSQDFMEQYCELNDAFRNSVNSILYDSGLGDKSASAMLKDSVAQYADALSALFDNYPVSKAENSEEHEIYEKIEKTVDVLNELDKLIESGEISVEDVEEILEGIEMADKTNETKDMVAKADFDAKVAELAKAQEDITKLTAEVEKMKADVAKKEATEPTDIWKGVNPAIKAEFEALKKKSEDNETIAKAAEEKTAMVELTKRVEADLTGIAGTSVEKAEALRKAEKVLDKETFEKLYGALKTASETIKKSELLNEKGNTGSKADGQGALAKIKAAAAELVTKGQARTEAEAIAKVAKANPALYKEYIEEGSN